MLAAIRAGARDARLAAELMPPDPWPEAPPGPRLYDGLRGWAEQCPLPVVLLFDEVDAQRGNSLRSVLRQIRDGFSSRSGSFPASVASCGLRDIRDYRAAAGSPDPGRLGTASPFNVAVPSLRVGDFSYEDVVSLYGQHTAETGQEFTAAAIERAFEYSQGQPWLVNALAREVIEKMEVTGSVEPGHIDAAKERLILARATHLDSLVAKLAETRVQRVIEPLIACEITAVDAAYDDDLAYAQDLGLIRAGNPVTVANPIYREVILRVLASGVESQVTVKPASFVLPGRPHRHGQAHEGLRGLLAGERGDPDRPDGLPRGGAAARADGVPASRRQRGRVYRPRDGVGRGRLDLLVEGLAQLDGYLDRLGLAPELW